jgi:hypothetical protein
MKQKRTLKALGIREHNHPERWGVDFQEEFLPEFQEFSEAVRRSAYSMIELLALFGPALGRPHADTLKGSKHPNMKELRFPADGGAWRICFAFDVKRRAILLVGGDKSGVSERKFYRTLVEIADTRFERHQKKIEAERKS